MGPLDTSRPWATKDVVGAHRFLQRLWRLVVDEETGELAVSDDAMSDQIKRQGSRTCRRSGGRFQGRHRGYCGRRRARRFAYRRKESGQDHRRPRTHGQPGGEVVLHWAL